ncbi:hypothetical protein AAFF_G00086820 [Aldrovandia affinis]|uniref:PPM-type phosphatase domain-containing protein n=1 Tax=Aldrovandia affinis TaxID=143900 RepID=A0AAD7RWV1_9TELE|nr:hypothetical protein AAFF_G00086820 [Aldrovandia affinis]
MKCLPLTHDEKRRIEDLGGCIAFMGCWRVNGTYAVSRAIGDFDQKPYISSDADCASVRLSGDEDYVLLACDGFFDTGLVAHAKSAGSSDNITVLLLFLHSPEQLLEEAGGPGGPDGDTTPLCSGLQEGALQH